MPFLADGGTLPPRAVSLGIFKEEFEMGTRGGLIVFRDQHIVSLSWLLGSSVQKTRGFVKILHYLEDEVSERTMTKTLILERIIQVARTEVCHALCKRGRPRINTMGSSHSSREGHLVALVDCFVCIPYPPYLSYAPSYFVTPKIM